MTQYTDVMVDIETTHTRPDLGAIIQIAAVKFSLWEQTIDTNFFVRSLDIPADRHWSEGTRDWWLDQKPGILQDIYSKMEPPEKVMNEFADWCYPVGSLRFWSKPLSFDFAFVESYFHKYRILTPFDFRSAMDLRSFVRGLYFPGPVKNIDIPFTGDAHNAIWDSLHQLKYLFCHVDNCTNS